jgi:hypothetical protein
MPGLNLASTVLPVCVGTKIHVQDEPDSTAIGYVSHFGNVRKQMPITKMEGTLGPTGKQSACLPAETGVTCICIRRTLLLVSVQAELNSILPSCCSALCVKRHQ